MCLRVCITPRDSMSLRYLPLIVIIAMILLGRHSTLQLCQTIYQHFFLNCGQEYPVPPAALLRQPHHSGSRVQLSGAFLAPCWKV